MDWFTQAIQDIGNAIEDGVEAVGEFVEDGVEAVVDFVGDTAEVVINTVEAVVDSTVGFVETVVDVATGESDVSAFGDWAMNTMDDLVFDQVDYITGGAVDVDYDDGQFSAGLDFGIGSAGVSFGEDGFSANAGFDIGVAEADMSYNSAQGFAATGSLGLDWGGLPTVGGHLSISPEGDVLIGGELQGRLPGMMLDVEGEMTRSADGSWSADGSVYGSLHLPFLDAGVLSEGSVSVAADGDFEAAGELDGYIETFLAEGEVTAGGNVSSDDGQFDASVYGEASGSSLGTESMMGGAAELSGGGGHLEVDVDTWGDSEVHNVFDPSVLVTDSGLGGPESMQDALGVAGEMVGDAVLGAVSDLAAGAGGLGMSGGAAAGQFADSFAESVTGTAGVADAPGGLGMSGGAAAGQFADSFAESVSSTAGVADAPGGLGMSGGAAAGQPSADPGTPEQWTDLGVGSSVETGAESDEPMVEVPEPQPLDDFSADLAAADEAGAAADDIWEGMETSEG